MKEPIKAGDLCIMLGGMKGEMSPNTGKIVTVRKFAGEHEMFGKIWRVAGPNLLDQNNKVQPELHVAESWLKKIEPPPIETKTTTKKYAEV